MNDSWLLRKDDLGYFLSTFISWSFGSLLEAWLVSEILVKVSKAGFEFSGAGIG